MEKPSTVIANAAIAILDACMHLAEPTQYRVERDGIVVAIHAGPVRCIKNTDDDLTECERDIMEVVREAGKRIKGYEIRDALEAAEKIHGESTITRALARLVHIQLLGNDHSKRGYFLLSCAVACLAGL